MKSFLCILLLPLFMSCQTETFKSIFNVWTEVGGTEVLDFREGSFGKNYFLFNIDETTECWMNIEISGSEAEGTMVITNDTCSTFDGSHTYKNNGKILTLCIEGTACFDYQ